MAHLGNIGFPINTVSVLGGGEISGVVLDASAQPVAHAVRAIHRASGLPSGSAMSSSSDGSYKIITGILYKKTPHTVIEIDHTGVENARIFDNVIPL